MVSGVLVPSGHLADVLQEANVPIISDNVCNAPDYYDNQITTTMFCAGYEKGGTDACQVSGSVLVYYKDYKLRHSLSFR